ncbi:hypothetical protein [Roseiarcus fermentans]
MDLAARGGRKIDTLPEDTMDEVLTRLAPLA